MAGGLGVGVTVTPNIGLAQETKLPDSKKPGPDKVIHYTQEQLEAEGLVTTQVKQKADQVLVRVHANPPKLVKPVTASRLSDEEVKEATGFESAYDIENFARKTEYIGKDDLQFLFESIKFLTEEKVLDGSKTQALLRARHLGDLTEIVGRAALSIQEEVGKKDQIVQNFAAALDKLELLPQEPVTLSLDEQNQRKRLLSEYAELLPTDTLEAQNFSLRISFLTNPELENLFSQVKKLKTDSALSDKQVKVVFRSRNLKDALALVSSNKPDTLVTAIKDLETLSFLTSGIGSADQFYAKPNIRERVKREVMLKDPDFIEQLPDWDDQQRKGFNERAQTVSGTALAALVEYSAQFEKNGTISAEQREMLLNASDLMAAADLVVKAAAVFEHVDFNMTAEVTRFLRAEIDDTDATSIFANPKTDLGRALAAEYKDKEFDSDLEKVLKAIMKQEAWVDGITKKTEKLRKFGREASIEIFASSIKDELPEISEKKLGEIIAQLEPFKRILDQLTGIFASPKTDLGRALAAEYKDKDLDSDVQQVLSVLMKKETDVDKLISSDQTYQKIEDSQRVSWVYGLLRKDLPNLDKAKIQEILSGVKTIHPKK